MNCSQLTRRNFGLCLAGASSAALPNLAQADAPLWNGPATVAKLYLAVPAGWPRPDLDPRQDVAEIEAGLQQLQNQHPGMVRFTGGQLVGTPAEMEAWRRGLGDVDGILVMGLTGKVDPFVKVLHEMDVPTLLFSRPYAGHTWSGMAGWARSGKRADVVASKDYAALAPYLGIFRTIGHLRRSKVLVIRPASSAAEQAAAGFRERFGTAIEFPGYEPLKRAYEAAPAAEAEKAAAEFVRGALRVVEPTPAEIRDSLRFYLAARDLLAREKANAMTIDCLGGFARRDLPAYPCVAWSKFNDQGYYGVCEADLLSTMTQMLVTSYTGMPGFVTDPVIDVQTNEVTHAHCVAATAMRGINGPRSPYIVRSHLEDHKGVSLQVLMPVERTITMARFLDPSKVVVSTAEVIDNVDTPRGCRTQIRTRVSDASKLLDQYSGGLHRVIFYGDHVKSIERMGKLMGFKVVREI